MVRPTNLISTSRISLPSYLLHPSPHRPPRGTLFCSLVGTATTVSSCRVIDHLMFIARLIHLCSYQCSALPSWRGNRIATVHFVISSCNISRRTIRCHSLIQRNVLLSFVTSCNCNNCSICRNQREICLYSLLILIGEVTLYCVSCESIIRLIWLFHFTMIQCVLIFK